MKHRATLATTTLLCLLLPSGVMAQAQDKQSPPIESRWVAKILRASGPDSVRVRTPGSQLGTDERNEIPRENERWLVLRVELKAPPNSTIDTEEIKVVDEGSAMYSPKGLNWQQDSFVLFSEMPSGLAVSPGRGREVLLLAPTGRTRLDMQSGESSEISLLFRVPVGTKPAYLQLRQGERIPVPLP